ncbi:MAG TPA: pro-sigmaK processing inhibitor BofA family protein [Mobilitalea sp.]|nr:pro-sigmaK processing inhibitor BofA family protein [Mobilitalea sp.]
MNKIILISIIVVCIIFIAVCYIRRRPDLIIDFALRACVGTAGIYLMDFVLKSFGYHFTVGINGVTVLSNGLLGLPGFILLYGLSIYYSFR